MSCPHCMQNAVPDGKLMSEETFDAVLRFLRDVNLRFVIVSGGEPTEHPMFLDFCRRLDRNGVSFTVCSNGMWIGDDAKTRDVEEVSKLPSYNFMQVYTNRKWYRLHEETVAKIRANDSKLYDLGVKFIDSDILNMQPLGRAKDCPQAMAEVERHSYSVSCLNSHLAAAQTASAEAFFKALETNMVFCKPVIDCDGDIHMSESCQCPSYGNVVADTVSDIWSKIRFSKPCGRCSLYKRLQSDRFTAVREILGMK